MFQLLKEEIPMATLCIMLSSETDASRVAHVMNKYKYLSRDSSTLPVAAIPARRLCARMFSYTAEPSFAVQRALDRPVKCV